MHLTQLTVITLPLSQPSMDIYDIDINYLSFPRSFVHHPPLYRLQDILTIRSRQ
jgi:hypothetical protein